MIELLFVVCLAGSTTECQEQSLLYQDISTQTCVFAAQPELAKWVETHPNFRIRSWKCQPLRFEERET